MTGIEKGRVGTFKCTACGVVIDGSKVIERDERLTCSDVFCTATVVKISDFPKAEYIENTKKPK